jgi:hypothetical protein
MDVGRKRQEQHSHHIEKLYNKLYEQYTELDKINKIYGGQQEKLQNQIAGNVKVYTGPKKGKFIINKHGKKVYIDKKTLNNDLLYVKKNKNKIK